MTLVSHMAQSAIFVGIELANRRNHIDQAPLRRFCSATGAAQHPPTLAVSNNLANAVPDLIRDLSQWPVLGRHRPWRAAAIVPVGQVLDG